MWWLLACQNYSIEITSKMPTTETELTLRAMNQDGKLAVMEKVLWYQDGAARVEAHTVAPTWTSKGQIWYAQATIDGQIVLSDAVEIVNTLPEIQINIMPEYPVANYDVQCEIVATDLDEDVLDITQKWVHASGIEIEGQTLLASSAILGDWTCIVDVSDGEDTVTNSKVVSLGDLPDLPDLTELLNNSSFEFLLDNWQYDGCTVLSEFNGRQPYEGAWMLFGEKADCLAWQEIDLENIGILPSHIDAQRLRIHADGYFANSGTDDDYDDQVRIRVLFWSEEGELLSQVDSMFAGGSEWVYRDAQRMIPIGTRRLEIQVVADWRADIWNDSFADALSVMLEVASPAEPLLIKEPMLQDYRQDAMKIIWETDGVDYDPVLYWGENLENKVSNIRSTWIDVDHLVHVAEIEGLSANQEVRYQVPIQDFPDFTFKTAPEAGDDFSMIWLGDNQEAYTRFTQHINNFAPKDPDMLFVLGDLVQWGDHHDEWDQMWWQPLQAQNFAQTTPILAARGNHDMDHPYAYAYVDLPGDGSAYSFMYGDVYILVLNSHADLFPSADPNFQGQYEYIEEELSSMDAQNAAFRLVAFHQAPFSNSSASSTQDQLYGNQGIRDFWVPLFEQYDVDAVLSGHYHSYQRGEYNGITYIVSGGGGSTLLIQDFDTWDWLDLHLTYQYTLMKRSGTQLLWETYDLNDTLIDSFVIQ